MASYAHVSGESSVPMTFVLPPWHQSHWACAAIPIDNHVGSINVSTRPSDAFVCELTCASLRQPSVASVSSSAVSLGRFSCKFCHPVVESEHCDALVYSGRHPEVQLLSVEE